MAGYPWAMLLADRGGEALESLIATLLIARHQHARQVNPSQGDGGIDVLLETPEGLVVWQIKYFASPLSSSQWGQVQGSWKRLRREETEKELRIAEYNLVTPWTPTRERYEEFQILTKDADFKSHWRGEAWLNLLADESTATMARFQFGPNALEQFVNAKAQIAGSPVELADSLSTLDAIRIREAALDGLRDLISDHYSIIRSVVPGAVGQDLPAIPENHAVMHQLQISEKGEWIVESVVPKSGSASDLDPIELKAHFSVEEGSEDQKQLEAWFNWGTPFTDLPATTQQTGGPFGRPEFVEARLSVLPQDEPEGNLPPMSLVAADKSGRPKARVQLFVKSHTEGMHTGWRHITLVSKEKTLKFDLWFKPEGVEMSVTALPLTGLDPNDIMNELGALSQLETDDLVSFVVNDGRPLIKPFEGFALPNFLVDYGLPIAKALQILQDFTFELLLIPALDEVTVAEVKSLLRIANIYAGEPLTAEWSRFEIRVPQGPEERSMVVKSLTLLAEERGVMAVVFHPEVRFSDLEFTIPHPLAETRKGIRLEQGVVPSELAPGQEVVLLPEGPGLTVTAMVAGWTPDSGL